MYLLAIDQIMVLSQPHPVVQMRNLWCQKKQDGDAREADLRRKTRHRSTQPNG